MIIFIAGFVGSGSQSLAEALAERLGFALLSSSDSFGYAALREAHKQTRFRRTPFDDSELAILHEDLAKRMPSLVTMYRGVVVWVGMHRKKPRQILLEAAHKLGTVRTLWVESDDDMADARMREAARRGGRGFAQGAAMRAVMQHSFEPFDTPIVVFKNDALGPEAVKRFFDFYTKSFSGS